jgi:hypothetical protein
MGSDAEHQTGAYFFFEAGVGVRAGLVGPPAAGAPAAFPPAASLAFSARIAAFTFRTSASLTVFSLNLIFASTSASGTSSATIC